MGGEPVAFDFCSALPLGVVATHAPCWGFGAVAPSNDPHSDACGRLLQLAVAGHTQGALASPHGAPHSRMQLSATDRFAMNSAGVSVGPPVPDDLDEQAPARTSRASPADALDHPALIAAHRSGRTQHGDPAIMAP